MIQKNYRFVQGALLGALILPLPLAAHADLNIEGELHGTLGVINDGTRTEFDQSSHQSSLSLNGSHEIVPDWSAFFEIGTAVTQDGENGDGGFWGSRDTYVGVKNPDYGALRYGIIDTPYEDADDESADDNDGGSAFAIDPRPDGISDWKAIMHSMPGGGADGGPGTSDDVFDVRAANDIEYVTPRISGVLFRIAFVGSSIESQANGSSLTGTDLKTDTGLDNNDTSGVSLSLNYVFGDFAVTYAFEQQNYDNQNAGRVFAGNEIESIDKPRAHNLMLQYGNDAGLNIGASYEHIDMDAVDVDGQSGYKRDSWYAFVSQRFGTDGANMAYVKYAQADDLSVKGDTGAIFWAAGIQRSLTDQFSMYVEYAETDNDDNATYGYDSGGNNGIGVASPGDDIRGATIGAIYSFGVGF